MCLLQRYELALTSGANELLSAQVRAADERAERGLDSRPEIDDVGGEVLRAARCLEVCENRANAVEGGECPRARRRHLSMRNSPASARRLMKLSASCSGFGFSSRHFASRIFSTISSHVPSKVLPLPRVIRCDSGVDFTSADRKSTR